MGWNYFDSKDASIIRNREKVASFDDYIKWYQALGEKINPSVKRLATSVEKDDLIWMRDKNHVYYLGRCTGQYIFNTDSEMVKHDACNQVPVEWHLIGNDRDGKVPGVK